MFDWLLNPRNSKVSRQEVQQAIDLLIEQVDPRLKLLPDARRRLTRSVRELLGQLQDVETVLPPSLDISPAGYSSDRRVGLLFASPQSLSDALVASPALREYFSRPSSPDQAHLLLSMLPNASQRLGSALLPDGTVRSDVPQTVYSFDRHRFTSVAANPQDMIKAAQQRGFALLCETLAANLSSADAQRRLLEVERQALELRLRNQGRLINAEALNMHEQLTTTQAEQRLEEVRQALRESEAMATLPGKLMLLRDILSRPEQVLSARTNTLWLDRMGVEVPAVAGGERLDFAHVLLGYRQQRQRAVLPARITRDEWRLWQERWPADQS